MDDILTQVFGRLTAHELVMEVMMANWLASMPEDAAKTFVDDFRLKGLLAYWPAEKVISDDDASLIIQDSQQMIDHFLDKAVRRSREIRAKLSRSPDLP